ncbi:MAG: hypothetical protein QOE22_55 [Candidatus Parcubacteria bacterium]|nr:hypothetical protein [Candidatus Parcubacteria bacterium]
MRKILIAYGFSPSEALAAICSSCIMLIGLAMFGVGRVLGIDSLESLGLMLEVVGGLSMIVGSMLGIVLYETDRTPARQAAG